MGVSRAADLYYTFRFVKLLSTKWTDTDAYAEGIIDDKGKVLIKQRDLTTTAQKDAYTTFHRLVFNMKRLMEKLPGGKMKIASYAAALYLLREETGVEIDDYLDAMGVQGYGHLKEDVHTFKHSQYLLSEDIYGASKGEPITIGDHTPVDYVAGIAIYKSKEGLYFTLDNIQ